MKKITDLMNDRFIIDPSILHDNTLDDMIRQLKIDVISYKDNEEILNNLYYTLRTYFNITVVEDILKSSLTDEEIKSLDREWKLSSVLKK